MSTPAGLDRLLAASRCQHGLVLTAHAIEAGITEEQLRHLDPCGPRGDCQEEDARCCLRT